MYLAKVFPAPKEKVKEFFDENMNALLSQALEVSRIPFWQYLNQNLIPDDRHLIANQDLNDVFLKSFLNFMHDPSVLFGFIKNRGSFGVEERYLFAKNKSQLVYLDNFTTKNTGLKYQTIQILFNEMVEDYYTLGDETRKKDFKKHLQNLISALDRFEVSEIYFLALQHVMKTLVLAEKIIDEKIFNIVIARVDERAGYSAYLEEQMRQWNQLQGSYGKNLLSTNPAQAEEANKNDYTKFFAPFFKKMLPKNNSDRFEK